MKISKLLKISGLIAFVLTIVVVIVYSQLSNRHKAIVKTTILHKLGVLEKDWKISNNDKVYKMISPTFLIDGIYKSMEGPKASHYIQLQTDSTLVWMTGFKVEAIDEQGKKLSNDFVCHMNVDINDISYFSSFNLNNRIGKQYPRLTSLSHGMEDFNFPEGFGIPLQGNDLLYITTQTLNHNLPKISKKIKHKVAITYTTAPKIPLMSKTIFMALPYDKANPYKSPLDPGKDFCIPVETKNHSYPDGNGNMLSGHWVIPQGEKIYKSNISHQLQLEEDTKLHAVAVHVHPFAERLTLFDKTTQKIIFSSEIKNHKKGIGLTNIEAFSSINGVTMYRNHDYELLLKVNNTSNDTQDMMGSMFLFFEDKELAEAIKKM